jgi:hypothetical protein
MTYPAPVAAQFDKGRHSVRDLIRFDLDTGPIGICSGEFDIPYGGLTYSPFHFARLEQPETQATQAAIPFTITLSIRAEHGLAQQKIQELLALPWRKAFVTGYVARFDPDTRALIDVEAVIEGRISNFSRKYGDGLFVVANCETDQMDAWEVGHREYSGPDQRLINATDTSMDRIEDGATEVVWFGRTGPKPK